MIPHFSLEIYFNYLTTIERLTVYRDNRVRMGIWLSIVNCLYFALHMLYFLSMDLTTYQRLIHSDFVHFAFSSDFYVIFSALMLMLAYFMVQFYLNASLTQLCLITLLIKKPSLENRNAIRKLALYLVSGLQIFVVVLGKAQKN